MSHHPMLPTYPILVKHPMTKGLDKKASEDSRTNTCVEMYEIGF